MTRITRLCSTLALALATAGTQAANYAGSTFEIEMIIFERPQGMARTNETWPASPRLEYPSRWVDFETQNKNAPVTTETLFLAEPEADLGGELAKEEELRGLESADFSSDETKERPLSSLLLSPAPTILDNKASALARGGDKVLFHKAWRQVLKQKRNSPAILIDGGDSFQGYNQLGGSVTLSVSRYLHISTNLWLSDFSTAATAEEGILLPRRPRAAAETPLRVLSSAQPANNNGSYDGLALQEDKYSLGNYEPITLGEPQLETEQAVYVAHAARLQHERRLRSGQLHYIDHPAFGILIEIRAVAKPKEENNKDTPINENNVTNMKTQ
ncbi:CsiV family protein [Microbulbifer epialgicus]|uniref:CsiV family protein n=1 Tax=Microbulbifer epialgicus TaxID=393907 RepID=A0ABV4P1U9_9GAMM